MRLRLFILALLAPAAALAAEPVSLASEVFVERARPQADGTVKIVREAPEVVTPGDKLVFVLSYRNGGGEPATGFTVTNPIPSSVAFASTEDPAATVSVDGGSSWGKLATLKIALPDGTSRPAAAADVTHVRWTLAQAIPAGSGGKLSFRGVVK
jgi:uncharacterized repeat protein (TIGR01451 family)